jgi:hypothetical protein
VVAVSAFRATTCEVRDGFIDAGAAAVFTRKTDFAPDQLPAMKSPARARASDWGALSGALRDAPADERLGDARLGR